MNPMVPLAQRHRRTTQVTAMLPSILGGFFFLYLLLMNDHVSCLMLFTEEPSVIFVMFAMPARLSCPTIKKQDCAGYRWACFAAAILRTHLQHLELSSLRTLIKLGEFCANDCPCGCRQIPARRRNC